MSKDVLSDIPKNTLYVPFEYLTSSSAIAIIASMNVFVQNKIIQL